MFVTNFLWPLKFKNNGNGREKKTYFEWGQRNLAFFFAWNVWGKKMRCFDCFFFQAKFFCRELSFAGFGRWMTKSGRKIVDMWEKNSKTVCVQNHAMFQKITKKKVRCEIGIFSSSEVHTKCGILINLVCNTFLEWCRKCEKMMDIDALWECSVLLQKGWKCLNFPRESIYFLVVVNILFFRKQLCWNLTSKNSMHLPFIRPQNFGTKFEIREKVLTNCGP